MKMNLSSGRGAHTTRWTISWTESNRSQIRVDHFVVDCLVTLADNHVCRTDVYRQKPFGTAGPTFLERRGPATNFWPGDNILYVTQ
jgi:hypothetical protein